MSAYTFVDITEASPTPALPSEAVWFDGICLDLEVSSFRTLGVQGREIAEKEIDTYDTGNDAGEAVPESLLQNPHDYCHVSDQSWLPVSNSEKAIIN